MSSANQAVFLSYASQDAEAAKRICEALRAAGVEVWFDQSELVGGDQWDAKIRGQIGSCALFMPIISANTQARREGYFRIEWKLAAQRTHAMADGTPFLLPLLIGGTRDAEALVPAEFKSVQWTKLPGGETPPAFCARVKQLLDGGPSSREAGMGGRETASQELGPPRGNRPSKWWWALPIFGVTMAMVLVLKEGGKKPSPGPIAPIPVAETPAAKTVTRVTAMLDAIDVSRAELDLASNLLEQAVKADPANARLFAAWALVDCRYLAEYYDQSPARYDAARRHVAQAASLDGANPEVRLTRAITMQQVNQDNATKAEALTLLDALRSELPNDPRVYAQLGWLAKDITTAEEWWARQAKLPGQAADAAFNRALRRIFAGDYRAGYAALVEASSLGRSTKVLLWKAYQEIVWLGDTAAAKRTMAEVPAEAFVEDMPASARGFVAYWSRDYEQALAASRAVPREFMYSGAGTSPAGYHRGVALARLGRQAAAENEWRAALVATERRLAEEPNNRSMLMSKAILLAMLDKKPEATQVWRTVRELYGESNNEWLEDYVAAALLPADQAIIRLQKYAREHRGWTTAAALRLNPSYDHFRADPAFVALQAEADADPRLSPTAAQETENREQRKVSTPSLSPSPSTPPDAKSVAVLAFANLSDDKGNEYFSDGISEELLNVLAKISGLKVAARTSAFYFKGKEVPVPEIARQLGVAYVVEGSVRRQGDKVRITAQLIKAADGFHVWSETFTRDLKDIFAVQDEIAGLIAKNLELKMGIGEMVVRQEVSPEAYQEYLLGRAAAAKAGSADLREAITHFDRAVALEPKYTAAWVQLASAHTRLGRWGGAPTRQAWRAARVAIDRARALEPDSPEVLLALGWVLRTGEWNWREAERAFRRALALQPNQPEIMAGAAVLLFNIGQTDEAFRLARQAIQLDPLNAGTQIDLSIMFHLSKNWAEAERSARRALQLAPGGTSYHCLLSWGLIVQQRYAEAEAEINLDNSEDGVDRALSLGLLALARGQDKVARDWLARLEEIARTNGDLADLQQNIAWLNTSLGEKERAFAALEKAYTSRDPSMAWLLNSWWLEPLYSDPRWPALLRKIGLAEEQLK